MWYHAITALTVYCSLLFDFSASRLVITVITLITLITEGQPASTQLWTSHCQTRQRNVDAGRLATGSVKKRLTGAVCDTFVD